MAGLLGPLARLFERDEIRRLASTSRVEAHIPAYTACTTCGFDANTQSALDPACPVCLGAGRLAVDQVAIIYCRVSWIDMDKFNTWQGVPTGEMGDCSMQAKLEFKTLMEDVQRIEGAYLLHDGKRLKPVSVIVNRIEARTSLDVRCVLTRDDFVEAS